MTPEVKKALICAALQRALNAGKAEPAAYQGQPNKVMFQMLVEFPREIRSMEVDDFDAAVNDFCKANPQIDVVDWRHGNPIDLCYYKK